MPQFSSANEACAWGRNKALLLGTSRMCVLVDFKHAACHDLTVFDDAQFLSNGRIELRALRYGPLRRAPTTLEDVAKVRSLECEDVASSWGPSAEVRAVARFDDGFTLVSTTPYSMIMKGPIAVDDDAVGCKPRR